jgi:hypothetical protein
MLIFLQKGEPASMIKAAPAAFRPRAINDGVILTKAALRAAERLGLSNRSLSRIIGLSEASVSRMGSGTFVLTPGEKSFELALMFVRLFRSLDAIVGGDDAAARGWMVSENKALHGVPAQLIQTLPGLVNVLGYLDTRRALV